MSLIDDILKGLPVNPLLREQVSQLNAQKAAIETENAILKDDNSELKTEIARLKKQIEELSDKDEPSEPDEVEVKILKLMADLGVDYFATDSAHERFGGGMSAARMEYHLQRLDDAGYAIVVFGDGNGSHYAPTQQGLELLVKKDLI